MRASPARPRLLTGLVLLLTAAAMMAGVPASGASAGGPSATGTVTGGWTPGTVEAILHTYPTTDQVFGTVFEIHPQSEGNPDIRPFDPYADAVYCAEDWHVLALAVWFYGFEVFEPSLVITRSIVWSDLNSLEATFVLDGALVSVGRSPIKAIEKDDEEVAQVTQDLEDFFGVGNVTVGKGWGVQWGRVLAPADLRVGEHTLAVEVTGSPFFSFDNTIKFTVSPADSAPCAT